MRETKIVVNHIVISKETYRTLERRNPSDERPKRPDTCIELRAPPLPWPVEVGVGVLLLVAFGVVVMFVHWTSEGIWKVEERVKSIHYTA